MEIFVFKTSVQTISDVEFLQPHINTLLGHTNWNFDLEDCDNIFRVEAYGEEIHALVAFFNSFGFDCEELF